MGALKQHRLSIAEQNDEFRRRGFGGHRVITAGVQAKGSDFVIRAVAAVGAFEDFDDANDPYEHHDFGAVTIQGENVFWKIDYYDKEMLYGSENPHDPSVTTRVLTIMLAEDY